MILFCRPDPVAVAPQWGFVLAHHDDGVAAEAPPNTLHVPFDGDMAALMALGKHGPEPALMGDAPTVPGAEDRRRRAEDFRPWTAPPVTAALLKGYLANARYEREVAGIVVDGVPVATDRASQGAVEKLASRAARDPSYKALFTGVDGVARSLDAKALTAIADRVGDHVDRLRARQAAVAAYIDAGQVKTFAAVDAALGA